VLAITVAYYDPPLGQGALSHDERLNVSRLSVAYIGPKPSDCLQRL